VLDFTPPSDIASLLPQDWTEMAIAFLRDIYERSHSIKSYRLYRGMLCGFFRLTKKSPDACTRNDIQAFMCSPCKSPGSRGRAPAVATRNARLAILSSLWRYASFYFERPVPNPTLGIRALKRMPREKKRSFSEEEITRFFAAIPTDTVIGLRDRAIFMTYFWTGKRRQEVARLRYGDIEACMFVEDGTARAGFRFRYYGKGRGEQSQYAELPRLAKEAIDVYLLKSGRLASIEPRDPLFVAIGPPQGGGRRSMSERAPLCGDSIRDNFKKYVRLAGLDATRLSVHSLRHTAAQQFWLVLPDIFKLSKFLDHHSVQTSQNYIEDLMGLANPAALLLEAKFSGL
jgi:integrase